MGLIITFLLGLFILLGAMIAFLSKNNKSFVNFSLGLAFSVIVLLVLLELVPHTLEILKEVNTSISSIIIMITCLLGGLVLLKLLDIFIPDHHGDQNHNLHHIGMLTSIALILHNIIEGMAVYNITSSSLSSGILISIGIGLHNIPLGMIIASTLYRSNKDKKRTSYIMILISLSTFLGGILMYLLNGLLNIQIQGIILSVTLGMLVYISIFELLPKIIATNDKKNIIKGILLGIVFIILALLFHHH